ncbi:MAG: glycosyltransferase family 9 protein [Bacteroidota bacterium]
MNYVRHRTKVFLNVAACILKLLWLRLREQARRSSREIIGVILIEHLGDIVACEPVARHLRKKYPDAILVWCVRPAYKSIVETNPDIDAIILVHCLTVKEMLIRSGLFTMQFDLHFKERYCALCGERIHAVLANNQTDITLENFYDRGNILQTFSQSAGLPKLNNAPKIYFPQSFNLSGRIPALPDRYIVVHCKSNTDEKDWQDDRWREFAEIILTSYDISILEVGTESVLGGISSPSYINLCTKTSILETAYIIRQANLFIGIDSGPAHIANAVGTFGILLMGSYLNFKRYNPFSGGYGDESNAHILRAEGSVRDIAVMDVCRALEMRAREWKRQ